MHAQLDQKLVNIPMSYCFQMINYLATKGIDRSVLLAAGNISLEDLETPDAVISTLAFLSVFRTAIALYPDGSIAYEMALNNKLTSHGFLGYAILSAANVGEVIDICLRYFPTRTMLISVEKKVDLNHHPPMLMIVMKEQIELHQIRIPLLNALTLEFYETLKFLTGANDFPLAVWLDYPEPHYFKAWADRLPPTQFNQDSIQVRMPLSVLTMPLATANSSSKKMALDQCEQELQKIISAQQPHNMRDTVLAILNLSTQVYPSITETAEKLNMSERTLKRRLQAQHTTFQQLLNEVRLSRALSLLENSTQSIENIALALGYTDPANFTRAFKKWTGISPKRLRMGHGN